MATEIERKFLVNGTGWRQQTQAVCHIRQAYLARTGAAAIRVRIIDDAKAFLTIKSAMPGPARAEFEYEIPVAEAVMLMAMREGLMIEKMRHLVPAGGGLTWEIDVFEGAHHGLVLAELELPETGTPFARPDWLGSEVTGERRYYNSDLAAGTASKLT